MPIYSGFRAADKSANRIRGITLIELMVAASLTAVIITAVCSVYFYAMRLWQRGQAANLAYTTAVTGIERMEKEVENACAIAYTMSYNEVFIRLPRDQDSAGEYVPVEINNTFGYMTGDSMVFYLSDESGNRGTPGNILWRSVGVLGGALVPDTEWSLYPENNEPRVSPIKSMTFVFIGQLWTPLVAEVTLTVERTCGTQTSEVTLKRCMKIRNRRKQ